MLIPSIDLMGGRIVQLVQGERLALESTAIDEWIDRFSGWPKVQLIDLDAAKAQGHNNELVSRICAALPCRVGGGIRSVERAAGSARRRRHPRDRRLGAVQRRHASTSRSRRQLAERSGLANG